MIVDLYSKRQAKLRGDTPDAFIYNQIPHAIKVQIIFIWDDTLGDATAYNNAYLPEVQKAYKRIVETLCREYGVFFLVPSDPYTRNFRSELNDYLLREQDAEKALNAIELSFRVIDRFTRTWEYRQRNNASKYADAAIDELNARFREHGIGYQFVEGDIIRVDSQYLHAEVVKPALALLCEAKYAGAQQEFLNAHEHYRHGRKEEALNDCLKAFESAMKIICDKRGWAYDAKATSKDLIKKLFDNNLIPSFWNSHFSGLRSTLEAGVPTARNRLGGHGQGTEVREIPDHIVAYVIHMTASAIVFLIEAEKALTP
jgi:hypothetical protein